eukprot:3050783-Karenia_brevis.AAC.1
MAYQQTLGSVSDGSVNDGHRQVMGATGPVTLVTLPMFSFTLGSVNDGRRKQPHECIKLSRPRPLLSAT